MPAGRTPKLEIDPDLKGRIMAYVRVGAFPERAAVAAGVHESTHYRWQAKGLEERAHRAGGKTPRKTWQVYVDYVDALEQAIAEAEMIMLGKVARGGSEGNASQWLLERRFRDRWGAKIAGPASTAPAASGPAQTSTPLDQLASRREQRSGKKTS